MKHDPPAPPELGTRDGLSYALFTPEGEPSCGVVVMHGAGSTKEGHYDFGRLCRSYGMAAVAYDARGHGRSGGTFGPTAFGDALAMCDLLRERGAPQVALRGSSMGGAFAIHAAALDEEVAAVVSICPAPGELLLRGLRNGSISGFEVNMGEAEPWLASLDVFDAVGRLGRRTALLLLHARGDELVPYTISEELHAAAHEPKRLILFPGGHHRSLQHDLEVQNLTAGFIERAASARAG